MNTNPTEYAHPEALIEAEWLEQHLNDKDIRVVESNEDILLYDTGHIPGAVHIDWRADLQDQLIRDYIAPQLVGKDRLDRNLQGINVKGKEGFHVGLSQSYSRARGCTTKRVKKFTPSKRGTGRSQERTQLTTCAPGAARR